MKFKFLLILSALMLLSMLLPQDGFSQQKKYYILFDNMEDQKQIMLGDTIKTDLFDECYWNDITNNALFGQYADRKPFSPSTFSEREITQYDVAIFVLGTKHHLGSVVNGIKILDKVKEMLAANKSVAIIGWQVIPEAFENGDADAKKFLQDWLGISNVKYIPHLINNIIYGFRVVGVDGDPISKGYPKECNREYSEGAGLAPPYRYYPYSPVFEVNGGKNAVGFDYVKEIAGNDITDVLITGVRAEHGKARIAFWSTNFDIANQHHTFRFSHPLGWAITWFTQDYPHPSGFLAVEDNTANFGIIEKNRTQDMSVVFMNSGREKFNLKGFEISGEEPAGSFEIIDGDVQKVMNPGDVHIVTVRFAPKEIRFYEDYLIAKSDAYNKEIEVKLMGQCGDQAFTGPRLSLSDIPIDFGSLPYGHVSDKNIGISNTGDRPMDVQDIKMTNSGGGRFSFTQTVSVPFKIEAGETYDLKVRYTSSDTEVGDYVGRIDVKTNALNSEGTGWVDLKARSMGNEIVSGVTLSATSIDFGNVNLEENKDFTLKISNSGGGTLRIIDIRFDNKSGGENLAQFSFLDGTNVTKPAIALAAGESHDLKIKFAPQSEKNYAVRIQITTNDPVNGGLVEIPVAGRGKDPNVSVKDAIATVTGFSIKVNPTPVNDNGIVEFTLDMPGNVEINVVDQAGRKVAGLYKAYTNQGTYTKELDAAKLSSGMYFLNVNFNGQKLNLPFVISK